MHEMSIAMEICDITERAIGDRRPEHVLEVAVEVGDLSGVEISSLEFCLTALLRSPPFRNAKPLLLRRDGDELRVSHIEVDECQ
jgi:hydrogenase nickel incorporation protein HypA/HybF